MYKKGGLVEKDSKFRLKHFVSGKYLSISLKSPGLYLIIKILILNFKGSIVGI